MTTERPGDDPPLEPTVEDIDGVVRAIRDKEAAAAGPTPGNAPVPDQPSPTPIAERRAGAVASRPSPTAPAAMTGTPDRRARAVVRPGPVGGLVPRVEWERLVADESERQRRYHRPASVVLVDIDGLGSAVERAGPGVVPRVAGPCGQTLVGIGRASDRISRLRDGRFGVLLRETDPVGARRYAARAVDACDPWLAATPWALRLVVRVAAPDDLHDLTEAVHRIEAETATRSDADPRRDADAAAES